MNRHEHPELSSPYWKHVKALHHETVASYTSRLLPANQESDLHKRHLINLALRETPRSDREETWMRIISHKAGLHPLHFGRAAAAGLHHRDGSQCNSCADGLGERWMCTHCSHGAHAAQYPHLDNIICRHHSRWVGPGTGPDEQRQVGPELEVAERQFRRLRRHGRMDARFFITLRDAFRTSYTPTSNPMENMTLTDIAIYPLMMLTATALTRWDFLYRLFDPRQNYATAYSLLNQQVVSAIGSGYEKVARDLWLYLRPTFLTIREHTLGKRPDTRTWAHDFAVPDTVVRAFGPLEGKVESFQNYLHASGDYVLTEQNWEAVTVHHLNEANQAGTKRRATDTFASICRSGHRITLNVSQFHKFHGPTSDGCRVCTNYLVEAGFNDLQTRYPDFAREFFPEDNNGVSPTQVLSGSTTKYNWRCKAARHRFTATPYNRVHRETACPVCLNRLFHPGENDIRTARPALAKEWHPTLNALGPESVSIGSPESAWWRCHYGHVWEAKIESRVQGHGCPKCGARKLHGVSLASAHPDTAAEWDYERNGLRTPENVAANSHDSYGWTCPKKQHRYVQRIDRRSAGSGCPFCARSKPFLGETDVASEHPLIVIDWAWDKNGEVDPRKILPGTTKYWWKCSQRHEQFQSIPHRVKSGGCPQCTITLRSGYRRIT